MFLLLGPWYANQLRCNQRPGERGGQTEPPDGLDTSEPDVVARQRLDLGPDGVADARHDRHGEVLHRHQQALRRALVAPRHAAGDEYHRGREAHVGLEGGEHDPRQGERPVVRVRGLREEEHGPHAEGDHAGGENDVSCNDVKGLGNNVGGEDADEAVRENVEGCGQRRGTLVALPELDGVPLPGAAWDRNLFTKLLGRLFDYQTHYMHHGLGNKRRGGHQAPASARACWESVGE